MHACVKSFTAHATHLSASLEEDSTITAVKDLILALCYIYVQGIAMAEIVSSLPSSGGPYFW